MVLLVFPVIATYYRVNALLACLWYKFCINECNPALSFLCLESSNSLNSFSYFFCSYMTMYWVIMVFCDDSSSHALGYVDEML